MPTNDERRKIAETLRSGVGTTDYMSDENFIEWLFSVVSRSCDGHILESLAYLIEPEERTCRNIADETYREFGEPFICSECGADPHEGENFFCGFSSDEHDWRFCPNCGRRIEYADE